MAHYTRRSRLLLVVALALVALAGTPNLLLAQDATPAATPAASPVALPGFLQRLHDAIVAGDGAAVAALYTEDGIYEDVPSGTIARGRTEIAAFIDKVAAAQADVVFRPTTVHEGNGWAVWEYVFAWADAKSGARAEARGATVFELDGGLIHRSTDYYVPHT